MAPTGPSTTPSPDPPDQRPDFHPSYTDIKPGTVDRGLVTDPPMKVLDYTREPAGGLVADGFLGR
jgi:hypothetical protein